MKNASQAPGLLRSRSLSFLFMLVTYCSLLLMPGWARGQTKVSATVYLDENVTGATKANLLDDTYAELKAHPGAILGAGKYNGKLGFQFPTVQAANSTAYVRIDSDEGGLLDALLGGSIGSLVTGLVDGLLLGDHFFKINIYNENTLHSLSANSKNGFSDSRLRLIRNEKGHYLLAITPGESYNRIVIENQSDAVVGALAPTKKLKVYNAYTLTGLTNCTQSVNTYYDGSGLTLDLLKIGGTGVKNPQNAIDGDENSKSEISVGLLGVAASMSQYVTFPTVSESNQNFSIKLSISSSKVINAEVLGAYEVIAYSGQMQVYKRSLAGGLLNGVDILGLLKNGSPAVLTFAPGVKFDRIEIRVNSLIGLNIASSSVQVYDVKRFGTGCLNPNIIQPQPTDPMLSNKDCGSQLLSFENADFPTNVVDGNNDTYTTLEASSGFAVGIGSYNGFVEMGFATPVAAGKTTYVRIDFDNEVLGGLLNGSVGGLLNGVVGNALFGNHYFTIEGKSGGAVVYSRSSNDGLSSIGKVGAGSARIVQDKNGHYYIAITPDVAINSVRITENLGALVGLGTVKTMNVYHACHATGSEPCEQGFATFSESSGITLELLGLGAAGVTDAQNAIDLGSDGKTNLNTASKISVGAVGVAGTMMQHVQFHGLSTDRDHFRVKMKMQNNGVVTANVLGSIIVKAYDGEQEVYSQRLNERLIPGLDLLNLLSSGQMVNLPFAPGKSFDRVAVGIASLVDANIISVPLEIYSIERFSQACPDPELKWDPKTTPPFKTPACVDEVTSFENVNFPYEAVTDNPSADTYATLTAGAGVAAGLGSYSSHIELKYSGVGAAAHEVSYIRVDTEGNLFKALLGGSLGNALGNVLGSVALGNQYIVVQAKDAAGNPVGTAHSSVAGFDNEFVKLVKDKDGKYYLAVTATGAYQSVRIEYHHTALVGAMGSSALKVYSMCRETEFDACEQATFTSWDGTGIALDIADLTKGGVANPEFAIDGSNSSNYSTLNVGIVGVGASVSQKVYFKTKSDITDELRVRLQLANPGILNLDLFGNTKLIFYDGEQNVKEMTLASGLINNIDLLGLFNSGGVQSFTFAPGVAYDRVEIRIATVAGVNTSAPIRLYGMSRLSAACPDPDFLSPNDVFKSPVCAEGIALDNVRAVDDVANAVDGDYNTYANMRSDAGAIFGIGNKESILELKYGTAVGPNTTSYLRIGDDAGILESLLSGSIGEAVYGLLNKVALGDNYFEVRAKNGANNVLEASSRNGFADANGKMKIVQDKAGRYYVAISPDVAYTSIEIKAFSKSLLGLLANGYNLHVYGMCHETDFSGCQEGFSTSWDGSGLSVGITGVGSYGVTDAFKALNNNNNDDYSTLSLGNLSVAGHIQQNIQYTNTVAANTPFRLKMAVGTGTVNVSVFDDIRIIGYKDGSIVYNQNLQTAVLGGVSLGTLFNNGGAHDVDFAMDQEVDEIALRLNSLVNATVGIPDIRLYYIVQDCNTPRFTAWKSFKVDNNENIKTVKGGEEVEYTIHVRNTGSMALNDYIVTDAIPANTTYVVGSGGTFANGAVTFTGIDVAVGATATVSFKVKVNENLTGVTKISNVALVKKDATDPGTETFPPSLTDPNEPKTDGEKGTDIPVKAVSTIETWKSFVVNDDPTVKTVIGGELVKYTIHVKNTGNTQLTNVKIDDELPAGVTHVAGGTLVGTSVRFGTQTAINIDYGQTITRTFTVRVNANLSGISTISNIATVEGDGFTSTPTVKPDPNDPNKPGASGSTDIPVIDNSKVTFTKVASGLKRILPGQSLTYVLTVENTGNKNLTNVIVTDPLNAIPDYFTDQVEVDGGLQTVVSGVGISKAIGNLAVGASATVTIKVTAVATLPDANPVINTATATFTKENNTTGSEDATETVLSDCDQVNDDDINVLPTSGTVCIGEQATFAASLAIAMPTGADFVWRRGSDSGPIVHTGPTLAITEGTAGTYTYIVSVEGGRACFETPGKTVSVTVNPRATAALMTTQDIAACEGTTIDLNTLVTVGGSVVNPVVRFYADAALTTVLPSTTVSPAMGTHTYYVTVSGDGLCENAPNTGAEIVVAVSSRAVAADIAVSGTTICEGDNTTLTAALSSGKQINNPTYKWYSDATLTTLVHTGANFTPSPTLTVTTSYFVTVQGTGVCENLPIEAKEVTVTVTPRGKAGFIAIAAPSEVCEGNNIKFEATLAQPTPSIINPLIRWYRDAALTDLIYEGSTFEILADAGLIGTHTLYVTVKGDNYCENAPGTAQTHTVTVNEMAEVKLESGQTSFTITKGSVLDLWGTAGPVITPATTTVKWYDQNNVEVDPANVENWLKNVSFADEGTYTFRVEASAGSCVSTTTITITVFDPATCPPFVQQRVYAKGQSWGSVITGGVSKEELAIDGKAKTYSTLTTGVGLLGIGTVWQNLNFGHEVAAGTPVTIKLGKEYSGLMVAGGVTVVAYNASGDIGVIRGVQGAILDLLNADNVVEFTFVPTAGGVAKPYTGVRVIQGAVLSVGQSVRLYGAYYTQEGPLDCAPIDDDTNKDILDLYHGVRTIGLGVASSLATVKDPWKAVDNNPNTFAEFWAGAGIINEGFITPVFKTRSTATDSLHITLAIPSQPVLSLSLLTNIKIQRYLGNTKVGNAIQPLNQNILGLRLLGLMGDGSQQAVLSIPSDGLIYDRVDIAYGKFVSVGGDFVNVYDVALVPKIANVDDGSMSFEVCAADDIRIQMQDGCTTYELFDDKGNSLITTDNLSFKLPTGVQPGTYTYYVQAKRQGCAVGPRQEITVKVNALPTASSIKLNDVEQTAITLAPYEQMKVEVTTDATTTIAKWEVNESGTWNEYTVAGTDKTAFTYAVPLKSAGSQVKFRALLTSEKGCDAYTSEIVLTIKAQEVDYDKSKLVIVKGSATADGVDVNTVEAQIRDKFDMPIAGITVDFTYDNLVTGIDNTAPVATDVTGNAVLNITSTKIGQVTIDATVAGTAITNSPALVTFVAGAIDFSKSNIEVVDNNATADGISKNKVVVNLMDAFSNPVANASVAYTVAGLPEAQPSALTGTSDANGQFELTLTSEKIGTASITATANGTAITVGSPALVTFVAGAIDFSKSNIEVVDNNATADGISKNKVVVNLMDAFSNPVADAAVAYTVAGLPEAQPSALTGTSDANGQFELTLTSEKIGTASITATANGTAITVGSPALVTFVAGAIDFSKSNIEVLRSGAVADGLDENKVVVNLMDAFSNPVANASVEYTVAGLPEAQPSALMGTSDANGQFELTLTSEKIGTASITATANGTAITVGSPALVTFVAGAIDFSKSNIEVVDNNATADGISKNKVVANLMDAFSNPVANAAVAYTVADLPEAQPSALTGTSDANGQFELTLTSEKIGTASITATANGTAITVGSPALVTFVAGAIDFSKSNIQVVDNNATANGTDKNKVVVNLMDAFSNPVANAAVAYTVAGLPEAQPSALTGTSDANGQFELTLTSEKIGTASITATANGTAITVGSPALVTFVAGAIDFSKSNIQVVDNNATADGISKNKVVVNLMDAFSNPVANAAVAYAVAGLPEAQPSALTGTSDANGQFELTLTSEKIGTASITATANGTAITVGSPALVTFVAGAIDFSKSNIEVVDNNATADGISKNKVVVNLMDAFSNPVANAAVAYAVAGLPEAQPSALTGTSDANGQFELTLTSEKIGTASITATANGTAITVGSPALVTFVAGAVDYDKSNLKVTKDNAVADGVDYNEFTAAIMDAFENPIANKDVVFSITNPDGTTEQRTITTDAVGQAVIETRSTKSGIVTVDAQVDVKSIKDSPAEANFVAGAVDYDKSNLKVTKDNAVADGVDYNEFTATIMDAFENPIANKDVVFNITNPDGTTELRTVKTDTAGKAVIPTTSTKAGKVIVDAQVDAKSINGSPAEAIFVVGAVDYAKSNLKVTKDGAIADGVDYNEFTATIMDAFENPIANKDVVFNITNPDGTKEQRTITTDAAGQAVIKTTSTKPGTVTVDAQVDAKSINGSPAIAKFVIANNLLIAKVADQTRVKAGTNTSFTVTITNNGPAKIEAGKVITLGEIPSTGLTITGYAVTSGNAIAAGTGNTATVTTNSEITVGGTIIVKVTAAVGADAPSTITNGIKVWGPDKDPGTDPEDDKDDTPEVPVDRESNLSIVKNADQTRVKAGENTTFTLTITNDGPSTIDVGKKIQLTERPGEGVTIDKYEIVGTNATVSGTANNAVVTTTAKIAKGQTIVVKVTAKVDADAPSTITNGITVWGPDKDPGTDPEDDTDDTPPVPVDRDYKLTIEKVADESKVKAGESTTFTVTITNNGPSVMEIGKDIKLVERPGAGVSIEKYEIVGSNATISSTGNNATVKTTAKLTVGGTIIVKITAKVDDEAPEKITNGISVWGPGKEPGTDPEDDKDDTPEVPVVYPLIQAVDDVAETKTAVAVEIDVLANDIVTKWDINPTSLEVVSSSVGATTTVGIDGKVTYISSRDKIGEDTFTYRVKDIKGRWSNTATVRVAVMNNDLDIPNIITPNGDGKNDEFRINGLELYDRVVLTIVNRWGNEVYKSNKYNNDWSGAGLSEGTYFYVLELVKGGKSEVQKGWVTIKSN